MELRPRWKIRWLVIALLMLPTLVWFAYSLRNPDMPSTKKSGDKLYRLVEVPVHAEQTSPWVMQESGTKAGLRGIYSVDGKIAWASGTAGTVLKTVDGGEHWQKCAVPGPDGETLDFRGVQAWDDKRATIMASGSGDKSRIYKTIDGCKVWNLLLKNTDKNGFWDALQFDGEQDGIVLGDPVRGHFTMFITQDGGKHWKEQAPVGLAVTPAKEAIFAASNSSLVMFSALAHRYFVTGGTGGANFVECHGELEVGGKPEEVACLSSGTHLPLGSETAMSGAFSLGFSHSALIAVGGDYSKPNGSAGTAAYSTDGGSLWTVATKPPHGYRSSVVWSEELKAWITAGTNGSDISRDDGKTWQPLDDGNWNALSLPFVVGPNGRIARLSPSADVRNK